MILLLVFKERPKLCHSQEPMISQSQLLLRQALQPDLVEVYSQY